MRPSPSAPLGAIARPTRRGRSSCSPQSLRHPVSSPCTPGNVAIPASGRQTMPSTMKPSSGQPTPNLHTARPRRTHHVPRHTLCPLEAAVGHRPAARAVLCVARTYAAAALTVSGVNTSDGHFAVPHSATSHTPGAARHRVVAGSTPSAGHTAELPVQRSTRSQTPVAVRQVVVLGSKPSAGQSRDPPVHASATSQVSAEVRQTVPFDAKPSVGQAFSVGRHVSATSQAPEAARHGRACATPSASGVQVPLVWPPAATLQAWQSPAPPAQSFRVGSGTRRPRTAYSRTGSLTSATRCLTWNRIDVHGTRRVRTATEGHGVCRTNGHPTGRHVRRTRRAATPRGSMRSAPTARSSSPVSSFKNTYAAIRDCRVREARPPTAMSPSVATARRPARQCGSLDRDGPSASRSAHPTEDTQIGPRVRTVRVLFGADDGVVSAHGTAFVVPRIRRDQPGCCQVTPLRTNVRPRCPGRRRPEGRPPPGPRQPPFRRRERPSDRTRRSSPGGSPVALAATSTRHCIRIRMLRPLRRNHPSACASAHPRSGWSRRGRRSSQTCRAPRHRAGPCGGTASRTDLGVPSRRPHGRCRAVRCTPGNKPRANPPARSRHPALVALRATTRRGGVSRVVATRARDPVRPRHRT